MLRRYPFGANLHMNKYQEIGLCFQFILYFYVYSLDLISFMIYLNLIERLILLHKNCEILSQNPIFSVFFTYSTSNRDTFFELLHFVKLFFIVAQAYQGLLQRSKIEHFPRIIHSFKSLTLAAKFTILGACGSPGCRGNSKSPYR